MALIRCGMTPLLPLLAALTLAAGAQAQAAPEPASAPVPEPEPEAAAPASPKPAAPSPALPPEEKVEGAIGLLINHSPSFPGAADFKTRFRPAGFIRYGRWTITGAGGFTTKRKDDVERGLGAQLVKREDLHVSLALRFDDGRLESDSPFLAGMGKVRKTVRGRMVTRWDIDPHWQLGVGVSTDLLGHQGGTFADLTILRRWNVSPATFWTLSTGFSMADARYMQTWHGVTAEQSAASGYPVYTPGGGLRDAFFTGVLRSEFAHRWAGFGGFAYSRNLGPSADSPLTRQKGGWQLNGGVVWRF